MILGADSENVGRKVFDLKITQAFPIISIDNSNSILVSKDLKEKVLDGYDHLSIPPDLRLHLTSHTNLEKHLNFQTDLVDRDSGLLKSDFQHLFTWMSKPIASYRQPHGSWHQAVMIFPPKDDLFTSNTSIFVDFFVHNIPNEAAVCDYPLFNTTMRFSGDNSGYVLGPHSFGRLIRGAHRFEPKFSFSARFGYHENSDGSSKIYIPLELK